MSKAVLISIRPEWCELIADGKKTVEIRKSRPNLKTPFKCYIYCSGGPMCYGEKVNYGRKKVLGEFVCDDCTPLTKAHYGYIEQQGRVSRQFLKKYMGIEEGRELAYTDGCYGWHISDLVIYDKSKELGEFVQMCSAQRVKRPPQSWCYVEELTKGGTDNG